MEYTNDYIAVLRIDLIFSGDPIYGYKLVEGTFTVVPDEAEIVRRIFGYYLDGLGSCKIAQILNAEHIPTLHNSAWRDNTIISMLTNRTYFWAMSAAPTVNLLSTRNKRRL